MKTIWLTNDDGFLSMGLRMLKECLQEQYDVYVVAPNGERSAVSMSLTIHRPLRIHQVSLKEYEVDGTPVDCVNVGIARLLPHPPDFVISGMNLGENLSEDVLFSGTVGGAFAGCMYKVPALAVSLIPAKTENNGTPGSVDSEASFDFIGGARIAREILGRLLAFPGIKDMRVVYNVNIPNPNTGKIIPSSLGFKGYTPDVIENVDPRGRKYYWLGGGYPSYAGDKGTDLETIKNGNISFSVLKYDLDGNQERQALSSLFNDKMNQ